MKIELEISSIRVLVRRGFTDKIFVNFVGPSQYPALPDEPPTLTMDVARRHGVEYVRTVFGVEPEIIEAEF